MKANTSLSSKNCFSPGVFDFSISSADSSVFSKHLLKPFYLLSILNLLTILNLLKAILAKNLSKNSERARKHKLQKIHIQSSYLIH